MTVRINRKGSAKVTPVSDTAYVIERQFDAGADSVFRALTEPELIRRWWGCEHFQWLECRVDLREGGHWRNAVRDNGQEEAFHGRYQTIERPHRLVNTEVYEGLSGGGPDVDEPLTLSTTELDEQEGVTTMRIHVECYSPEGLQGVVAAGPEMQESYDRMDDLLAEQ